MMIRRRTYGTKGFTLVELLIVVAIIGVLATVGIPTFRRMVQKARKSEAKVGLGGLYTAEAGFQSEYGGYGDNLKAIGFELEGSNRIFSMGFPGNGGGCTEARVPMPDQVNSNVGKQILAAWPAYYTEAGATKVLYLITGMQKCENGSVTAPDGADFVASATGNIAPGITVASNIGCMDTWTMNKTRTLVNTRDGVGATVGVGTCN